MGAGQDTQRPPDPTHTRRAVLTYGPHQTADAPTTLRVEVKGSRVGVVDLPLPKGLIHQRRRINELASGTLRRITDRNPS